jgi:hypothetical protein
VHAGAIERTGEILNMDPLENLHSLHKHEEEIRVKSLEAINADRALDDHLNIISEAMNLIYVFSHDYHHQDDDELTYQLFGVRLFNAAGASIKLALSGYYQKAFDHVRDILETYFFGRLSHDAFRQAQRMEKGRQEAAAKRLSHAAVILVHDHKGVDRVLLATRAHYLNAVNAWAAKYLGGKPPTGG